MTESIFEKLKNSGLVGRGGAAFPTYQKWQIFMQKKSEQKYVICNVSEGEPGVHKDEFLLENHAPEVVSGLQIAMQELGGTTGYIFLRKDLYRSYKDTLQKLIGRFPIFLFKETGGYLAGEESTLISNIEGKRIEPKIRPPYPVERGLHNCPTLIHNTETLYDIYRIANNTYTKTRFYTISGAVKHAGVYEYPEDASIESILRSSGNFPDVDFFVQVGGGASGEIKTMKELGDPVGGSGAIVVYDKEQVNPWLLLNGWITFFLQENCDKCVPCREGLLRLQEMFAKQKIDKPTLDDLLLALDKTSFCPLGRSVPVPIRSFLTKIFYAT